MSAHLRPLRVVCAWPGCQRRPTVEVYNTYNAPDGAYCRPHGRVRVKELQAGERWMRDGAGRA